MPFVADAYTGKDLGKYGLLCRLAVGGMAEIFLAFPRAGPHAFTPVVLKRILEEEREDEKALRAIIDEARLTVSLDHPNVARVLDLDVADDEVLLVIEFIRGATVDELSTLVREQGARLPLGFVVGAVQDFARGLAHAHARVPPIVHRDVTPKNLMVDFDGVGRVLDFGIAKAVGSARRTVAGMVRGTAAYMSPEQAIDLSVDQRSDVFSLGTVLHELLTGRKLFHRGRAAADMAAVYEAPIPTPSSLNAEVSAALDAVVLGALQRKPERRTPDAGAFLDALLGAGVEPFTPQQRAAYLRERFPTRRAEIAALLSRMGTLDEPHAVGTRPGRPGFTAEAPRLRRARAPLATEVLPVPAAALDEPSTHPTDRFSPHLTPPRPPGPRSEMKLSQVGEATELPPRLGRAGLAVVALLALALGIAAAVWVRRAPPPPPPSVGVGRVSLQSRPPSQVYLGEQSLGPTPVVDLYLSAGPATLTLVGPDGARHRLDVVVPRDGVVKKEVVLDTLPSVP
ncbi:MAG: serine/threonine protein kinase [Myxococcaceae bacterium]|nr:serine/threonine protein kinase [Myxococcaceae bacterium]